MKLGLLLERALPRTLAGRMLMIILAGLAVAHLASFVVFDVERSRELNRLAAAEIAARVAHRAGARTGDAGQAIVGIMSPLDPLRWSEVQRLGDAPAEGAEPPSQLLSELRQLLTGSFGSDPVVWASSRPVRRPARPARARPGDAESGSLRPSIPPPPAFAAPEEARRDAPGRGPGFGFGKQLPERRGFTRESLQPYVLTLALALPDGRQVIAEAPHAQMSMRIPSDVWLGIAVVFAVTAGFSMWAVRIAVRPVRVIAAAAERLSRNLEDPPLPETGAKELRTATRAFNRMQDRLRRHVNTRALAFAAMSHDMRTPLTRTRLRLESLDPALREKFVRDLDEIESLVKAALEATRTLVDTEAPMVVDVAALVAGIAADAKQFGHEVAIAGSAAPIEARSAALRRALVNLVDNACKYASDASVELLDSRSELRISVSDRGPGLPPDEIPRVVAPFYRVEASRNRNSGGMGLGLAIAKDIVEGHGGELLITNREGGGLRVTLILPR